MCGINGYIDKSLSSTSGKDLLEKMNFLLSHRGPDGSGIFIDGEVGLGHTRLSIIDLSSSASQPMVNNKHRSALSFNGEIYNFLKIKSDLLQRKNCKFFSDSDTEVLLNLISHVGIDSSLNNLEGMYAFSYLDQVDKKLFLVRDRFGEKPLYYYFNNNKLYYSSELKPLISCLKDQLSINYKNLDFFLKKSYLPVTESIFNEIKKVEPGSYLEFDFSRSIIKSREVKYWNYLSQVEASIQKEKNTDFQYHKEQLKELLKEKIEQAMISDVPLGAFLSGGYDSTCMASIMQSISNQSIKTFSIGFEDKNFNEAPFAKEIANHLGTEHEELYVSEKDLLNLIPELPDIYSEPFADSSQIPTVLLSRLTRSKVTVSISGDGGDEIFGGYGRYFLGEKVKSYLYKIPLFARKSIQKLNLIKNTKSISKFFLENKVSNFENKINKLHQIIAASSDKELFNLLSNFNNKISKSTYQQPLYKIWNQDCSYSRKAMTDDAIDYLPGDILNKVDIAGMSCSLETRIPFLNHKIAEYVLSLPHDFLISNGSGKLILKEIVHDYVPPELMERPKRGFEVPLNSYLRNELKDYSESMINFGNNRFTDHLNFEEIYRVWDDHINCRNNQPHLLWNLVTFFAWYERNVQ